MEGSASSANSVMVPGVIGGIPLDDHWLVLRLIIVGDTMLGANSATSSLAERPAPPQFSRRLYQRQFHEQKAHLRKEYSYKVQFGDLKPE
jgi:hypothetical protein